MQELGLDDQRLEVRARLRVEEVELVALVAALVARDEQAVAGGQIAAADRLRQSVSCSESPPATGTR